MKQLVIILFFILVTEVITKSFNSQVDTLKLFLLENGNLLQNENLRGQTQPINGKTLQQTQRQLQNKFKDKIIDNFYSTPTNYQSKTRDINGKDIYKILMENNQNLQLKSKLNHMFYPDYLRRILSTMNYPLFYKYENDEEFDDANLWNRKLSLNVQHLKYNPLWSMIHKKIINKRNSRQTTFIPSVSVGESYGALANLGQFFENLQSNVDFIEKTGFTGDQRELLDGDHAIKSLRRELDSHTLQEPQRGDFLHAVRNYRPSQKVRALVSMTPEGYHGSNFIDPNYMWLGLGK